MGRFVDSMIALRILKLLVTPFEDTDAFRLGIIDSKGKELKKMRDLNTVEARDAYTLLHRLVFRLKRIINKVPIESKKLVSLAAAYALVREHLEAGREPLNLEEQYLQKLKTNLSEEVNQIKIVMDSGKMFTFKQFVEDAGAMGVAPANNAVATPGIAGLGQDVPVGKKAQKKWTKANAMFKRGKPNG